MNERRATRRASTLVAAGDAERQFRAVVGPVDRSVASARRFWCALPLLAVGRTFIVLGDERIAMLAELADQVSDRDAWLDPLGRSLAA